MKDIIVYYHAHCADGFGAAFAAWVKFGDSAEYIACNYGDEPPLLAQYEGRDVHIVDFSFPREVMQNIFTHARHLTWLDHHKTAFEMWCETEREYYVSVGADHVIVLDNNQSGALIAWGKYNPGYDTPFIIKCIDDRDRWQFRIEQSRALHAGLLAERPWSFEQWMGYTHLVHDGGASGLVTKGRALLASDKLQRDSIRESARGCHIVPALIDSVESYQNPWVWGTDNTCYAEGLAVNAPVQMSEIGNELAQKSGTYGLVWYMGSNGKAKCSFRSIGDYDVSQIAKLYGGGGHKNAAGCEVEMSTLLGWLK